MEMEKKTVKELRDIAKELKIVGRWDMTKAQLISAIEVEYASQNLSDDDIVFETDCIIKEDNSNQSEGTQKVSKTTDEYIKTIKEGTLVAFKRNKNKDIAMSGKFVGFDETNEKKVLIESKKGTLFKVNRENILWVKTGSRWPKWVFSLFNHEHESEEDYDNAVS